MKKYLILLATVYCLPYFASAQIINPNVEVQWGDIFFGAPKSKNMYMLGAYKVDGEYVLLRKEPIKGPGGYMYFVERFDEDFNRLKSINISSMMEQKNRYIKDIRKIKDALLIVTTDINKSEKTIKTYGQMISFPSLQKGKQVLMYSGTYKKRNSMGVHIKQSQDENNLMVVLYPPYEKGEKEKVKYNVYSSNLELLFERDEVELNENDDDFRVDETIITNDAQVLLMGTVYPDKDDGDPYYKIYRITADNEESFSFEEDFEGITVSSPSMFQTKNGNLVGGGYYTGESSINLGAFLFRFDVEDMEVTEFIQNAFTDEFIKEGISERAQKKVDKKKAKGKEVGITHLVLKDIIPTNDGGFFMVGAVQYIYTSSYTDSNGHTRTTTHYVHNDIVVSKVSNEQEFLWTQKIKKREEVSSLEYGTHYEYVQKGTDLYFFFRDYKTYLDDHNANLATETKSKKVSGPVFGATTVNEDGDIERMAAFDYSEEKYEDYRRYNLATDVYTVDNHGEVIALTYFGKKRFGVAKISVTE